MLVCTSFTVWFVHIRANLIKYVTLVWLLYGTFIYITLARRLDMPITTKVNSVYDHITLTYLFAAMPALAMCYALASMVSFLLAILDLPVN
jgi:hypothetical protein